MFILPIIKDNPVRRIPVVLLTVAAINTLVLAWTYIGNTPRLVFATWGFTPAHPLWTTAFTSMFLHAGFWHLIGNMWFLWMFGNLIENCVGRLTFIVSYVICGFGALGLHYLLEPSSTVPLVGASGAISGMAGMFFVLFPKQEFELCFYFGWWSLGSRDTKTWGAVGAWIGEQFVLALLTTVVQFSSVAFWAHIGGFITGLILGGVVKAVIPERLIRKSERGKPWYYRPEFNKETESDITQLKL